ncbi:MAG TPA: type I methionyl aminopeptidase [Candidatus Scatovivens faecipullorum]|nr:type I methionyl aminopeptidase [Candidatus Scatovivens faecipullorum]
MISIKSKREIELMKEACKLTALTYDYIEKIIRPGMSTLELDNLAEKFIRDHGGIPAQKGYPSGVRGVPDFPGTLCISINDVVIHGIPSKDIIIKDGDIVSVDLVVLKNGYNGDAARTFLIGNCSDEAKKLVAVTKQAFFEGLKCAKPGNRVGDISHAVETYVRSKGFNLVREFQGHGIGKEMHEEPGVPNIGKAGRGPRLEKGMTICIEPMVMAGKEDIWELEDGWTIATQDGSLSAHYENTILITENEPKILTIL